MTKQHTRSRRGTETVVGLVPSTGKKKPTTRRRAPTFNPKTFLGKVGQGKTTLQTPKNHLIFSQGDAADAVFYVHAGRVKLTVLSQEGKEAVVAILEQGNFFGEGCLAGQLTCMATATALEASIIVRIDKTAMIDPSDSRPLNEGNLVKTAQVAGSIGDSLTRSFRELRCFSKRLLVVQNNLEERTMYFHSAVVLNKAQLSELVEK